MAQDPALRPWSRPGKSLVFRQPVGLRRYGRRRPAFAGVPWPLQRTTGAGPAAGGRARPPAAACWSCGARPGSARRALLHYVARPGRRLPGAAGRRRRVRDGAAVRRAAPALRAAAGPPRACSPQPQREALRVAFGLAVRPGAGPLPRRPGRAHAAGRGGRDAAAAVRRRRSPVARRGLRAGARVRRPPAARRARRDRLRRARAERAPACRGFRSCRLTGSTTRTRARCWRPSSPAGSTSTSASGLIAETRGNPLALLELPRGDERRGAGRRIRSGAGAMRRIEDSFRRRLDQLPADTRRLLQLAAADPVGEPLLVWRAAEQLGIGRDAAAAAADAGLLEIGAQVRFRHPSVRSAAYRSASPEERHAMHAALARRHGPASWIRTAAPGTAPRRRPRPTRGRRGARALGRTGARRAAASRPPPRSSSTRRRSRRSPPPARAACSPRRGRSATRERSTRRWSCWSRSRPARVDALQAAEIEQLRGEIAFDQRRGGEAARLLIRAARRFDALDAELRVLDAPEGARRRDVGRAGPPCGGGGGRSGRAARRRRVAHGAVDLLVDAFALRVHGGLRRGRAGAPARARRRARAGGRAATSAAGCGSPGPARGAIAAMELWDAEAWHALVVAPRAGRARHGRARAAAVRARSRWSARTCSPATWPRRRGAIEEVRAIARGDGHRARRLHRDACSPPGAADEALTAELIARETGEASERGIGRVAHFATYAAAVLYNGLGRYDAALSGRARRSRTTTSATRVRRPRAGRSGRARPANSAGGPRGGCRRSR